MKAKVLQGLVLNEIPIAPGSEFAPVVVELNAKEFARLEAMGVVGALDEIDMKLASINEQGDEAKAKVEADEAKAKVEADEAKAKSTKSTKGVDPSVDL